VLLRNQSGFVRTVHLDARRLPPQAAAGRRRLSRVPTSDDAELCSSTRALELPQTQMYFALIAAALVGGCTRAAAGPRPDVDTAAIHARFVDDVTQLVTAWGECDDGELLDALNSPSFEGARRGTGRTVSGVRPKITTKSWRRDLKEVMTFLEYA
jgi:hypothetical protein